MTLKSKQTSFQNIEKPRNPITPQRLEIRAQSARRNLFNTTVRPGEHIRAGQQIERKILLEAQNRYEILSKFDQKTGEEQPITEEERKNVFKLVADDEPPNNGSKHKLFLFDKFVDYFPALSPQQSELVPISPPLTPPITSDQLQQQQQQQQKQQQNQQLLSASTVTTGTITKTLNSSHQQQCVKKFDNFKNIVVVQSNNDNNNNNNNINNNNNNNNNNNKNNQIDSVMCNTLLMNDKNNNIDNIINSSYNNDNRNINERNNIMISDSANNIRSEMQSTTTTTKIRRQYLITDFYGKRARIHPNAKSIKVEHHCNNLSSSS